MNECTGYWLSYAYQHAPLITVPTQQSQSNAISRVHCNSQRFWAGTSWKGFPYSLLSVGPGADPDVQVVSLQVTISHPPGGRLPLVSARPAVTFPAAEYHRCLAGTKLYCLVTEAHSCEQLAQGCYAAFATSRIWNHNLLIARPTLYPLCHHAFCRYEWRNKIKGKNGC